MNKSILAAIVLSAVSFSSIQACQHLQPTSSPVPVVMIKDVQTGQEKDLLAEFKDHVQWVAFGNLSDHNFAADIKALNKLQAKDSDSVARVVVIMDTKDLDAIKKFIAENEITVRVVIPAQDDWQKNWPGVVNRSVFVANKDTIVAKGVDVVGNEGLIRETTEKLLAKSS